MIKEVKQYFKTNGSPSAQDFYDGYKIACENHCFVRIEWFVPYSGNYSRIFDETANIDEIIEGVENMVYPI